MYVDHRLPYQGDHGIQFEPMDDTPETREQLAKVKVRKGRVPAGRNALDERVAAIHDLIPWVDATQKYHFTKVVKAAGNFEELPAWCQQLILEAEGKKGTVKGEPSASERQVQDQPGIKLTSQPPATA
jgi:hypothetical protein